MPSEGIRTESMIGPQTNLKVHGRMAMATTVGGDSSEGRLVVVGDSDFARNRYMAEAYNADLFLNIVAWLAGQETVRVRAS